MDYDAIVSALSERRVKKRLKQDAVASDLGHTQGWLSHIENKRKQASWDDLRAIAGVLGCTLTAEILEDGEDSEISRFVSALLALPPEKRDLVRRFIRLLGVLEPRDIRREAADFEILEEEYGLPLQDLEVLRRA